MPAKNIKKINSVKRAICLLLLGLATLQLDAEVRFTGENPEHDEKKFRQALTTIMRADPNNQVLSMEEMEKIVNLEFNLYHPSADSYVYFPDGRNPEILIRPSHVGRSKRVVATVLAHEGIVVEFTGFLPTIVENAIIK